MIYFWKYCNFTLKLSLSLMLCNTQRCSVNSTFSSSHHFDLKSQKFNWTLIWIFFSWIVLLPRRAAVWYLHMWSHRRRIQHDWQTCSSLSLKHDSVSLLNWKINVNKSHLSRCESEHISLMFVNTIFEHHRMQLTHSLSCDRSAEDSPGCCWTGECAGSVTDSTLK